MKRMTSLASKGLLAVIAGVFAVAAGAASVQDKMSKEAIEKRIQPLAQNYVAGEESSQQAAAGGTRSGEQVYNKFCVACHSAGVMGAPKVNNAGDWGPRLDQGMDTVLSHALNGYNSMPPKGTCADCSEDEIKSAIEFMTSEI